MKDEPEAEPTPREGAGEVAIHLVGVVQEHDVVLRRGEFADMCPCCRKTIEKDQLVAVWRSEVRGLGRLHFRCIGKFWPGLNSAILERINTDPLLCQMVVLELGA